MRPFTDFCCVFVAWALISCLLVSPTRGLEAQLAGIASVVDGDTIEIHGTRIRIFGVDAPESAQLCRGNIALRIAAERRQRMNWTSCLSSIK
jgi:endonuclease YncB( thermonuclease family)